MKEIDFDAYKFRCSAIGKIISKSGKLIEGNKTYLRECFIGEMHDIRKDISSKYFDKGNLCEQDAMQILQDALYPKSFVKSFKKHVSNDFIQGTPDVVMSDYLYDIKNAYDRFTFANAEKTWEYEWQIKAYLWLTGKTKGRLFYTLTNMPEELIQDEERKLFYSHRPKFISTEQKEYLEACEELRKKLDFTKMAIHERFKLWEIELTESDIETMKTAVINGRNYMKELYKETQDLYIANLELMKSVRI